MTDVMTTRAKDAETNGFTAAQAIRETIGFASTCWTETPEGRVFEPELAALAGDHLMDALAILLRIAINQQSIDALAGMADWELVELILQAPVMGWEED